MADFFTNHSGYILYLHLNHFESPLLQRNLYETLKMILCNFQLKYCKIDTNFIEAPYQF